MAVRRVDNLLRDLSRPSCPHDARGVKSDTLELEDGAVDELGDFPRRPAIPDEPTRVLALANRKDHDLRPQR